MSGKEENEDALSAAELREMGQLVNVVDAKLRDDCRVAVTFTMLTGKRVTVVLDGAVCNEVGLQLSKAGIRAVAERERRMGNARVDPQPTERDRNDGDDNDDGR